MVKGIIIKGISGLYYVKSKNKLYKCKARGLFRKQKIKPLVGDKVYIDIDDSDDTGYIMEIENRENKLIRPPVANVNQAIIVFSVKDPEPNLWLLDRFLLLAERENLESVICFNKIDLVDKEYINFLNKIYNKAGYEVLNTSTKNNNGILKAKEVLKNKISVFAGPSGVGKSSLLNSIQPNLSLKTGDISEKTKRGKHTTRSTELLELDFGGWVVDTPGFSSLKIDYLNKDNLYLYFKEIRKYSDDCKFNDCKHDKEPGCKVKEALKNNEISKERYENYLKFLKEIQSLRRY